MTELPERHATSVGALFGQHGHGLQDHVVSLAVEPRPGPGIPSRDSGCLLRHRPRKGQPGPGPRPWAGTDDGMRGRCSDPGPAALAPRHATEQRRRHLPPGRGLSAPQAALSTGHPRMKACLGIKLLVCSHCLNPIRAVRFELASCSAWPI